MFVEVIRLLIVLLALAAGYALGGGGEATTSAPVIGAVLGASIGYVAGGAVGRLLERAMGVFESQVAEVSAAKLLAGGVGGLLCGGLAGLVGAPAVVLLPGAWGWPVLVLLVWMGTWSGFRIAASKSTELLGLAGLSTRPLVTAHPYRPDVAGDSFLLDTSAIIDGRLLPLAQAGFLHGALLVPRFVLDELQGIADAQDATRRRRGRRGLELLEALGKEPLVEVHVLDDEMPGVAEVDAKLVALARRLSVGLVTTDEPLQRVAELQGVTCLNLHRLADSVRPVHVSGETVRLPISRAGKEPGQGVGFLEDGSMVVVGDAAALVGNDAEVRITSSVETSMGRLFFASLTTQ
jgi:uncharacterized protein YacL